MTFISSSYSVNEADLTDLRDYTTDDLCKLVEGFGFSEDGMQTLRANQVSGSWLVEFDENDIKDLLTEFRDRFLVRKILARFASQSNSGTNCITGSNSTELQPSIQAQQLKRKEISGNHEKFVSNSISSLSSSPPLAATGSQRRKSFKRDHVVVVPQYDEFNGTAATARQHTASTANTSTVANGVANAQGAYQNYGNESFHQNGVGDYRLSASNSDGGEHLKLEGSDFDGEDLCDSESPALPVGEAGEDAVNLMNILSILPSYIDQDEEEATYMATGSPVFLYPCPYSFDDLLERKPKAGSATPATHYFLAVLRQVATETGLWGPAPPMKDIPPSQRDSFIAAMAKRVPGIEAYQAEIFKRLAMALQNRRKYKRERRRLSTAKNANNSLKY